jgi:hypothetical protein
LVIFNGPSPSDRLDDYKNKCTTSVLHGCSLTPDSLFGMILVLSYLTT